MRRTVCLMASEISALAGRHSYRGRDEAVVDHMIRYEKDFCEKARRAAVKEETVDEPNYLLLAELYTSKHNVPPPQRSRPFKEEVEALRLAHPELEAPMEEVKLRSGKSVEEVAASVKIPFEFADVPTANETVTYKKEVNALPVSEAVKEYLQRDMAAQRGVQKENNTIERLQGMGYDVRASQQSYKRTVNIGGEDIMIYGKVDGLLYEREAPKAVVEVKNRMNKFWVPSYDRDQLAIYAMISGLDVLLVQQLGGELKCEEFKDLESDWERLRTSALLAESIKDIQRLRKDAESEETIRFAKDHLLQEGYTRPERSNTFKVAAH